jgi:hypothetical protein
MLKEILNKTLRIDDAPRSYIGASIIGNPCDRAIYYSYKGAKCSIEEKTRLTFKIGKAIEELVIDSLEFYADDLSLNGIETHDNTKIEVIHMGQMVDKEVPELQGTPDAVIKINDELYVLEIKTANNTSFSKLLKERYRRWREQYYAQIQVYMGLCDIKKAIALVINKDTSEVYEEVIEFDEIEFECMRSKSEHVMKMTEPPKRLNDNPLFFVCKMCQFNKVCHG